MFPSCQILLNHESWCLPGTGHNQQWDEIVLNPAHFQMVVPYGSVGAWHNSFVFAFSTYTETNHELNAYCLLFLASFVYVFPPTLPCHWYVRPVLVFRLGSLSHRIIDYYVLWCLFWSCGGSRYLFRPEPVAQKDSTWPCSTSWLATEFFDRLDEYISSWF